MASLVLAGDTSGSITVSAPAIAGSTTQTLVNVTGTLAPVVSGTAVTASSTSVDFTSIPSWVKRVTVMLRGVSSNGTSNFLLQLGTSSGFVATGYSGAVSREVNTLGFSTGFQLMFNTTAATTNEIPISLVNVSANTWMGSFISARSDNNVSYGAGAISLGGTLDRVRITTVNGTDTFDAGTINILYE
jgi:hypothetical protein